MRRADWYTRFRGLEIIFVLAAVSATSCNCFGSQNIDNGGNAKSANQTASEALGSSGNRIKSNQELSEHRSPASSQLANESASIKRGTLTGQIVEQEDRVRKARLAVAELDQSKADAEKELARIYATISNPPDDARTVPAEQLQKMVSEQKKKIGILKDRLREANNQLSQAEAELNQQREELNRTDLELRKTEAELSRDAGLHDSAHRKVEDTGSKTSSNVRRQPRAFDEDAVSSAPTTIFDAADIRRQDCEKLVDGLLVFEPARTMREGQPYTVFVRMSRAPGIDIMTGLDPRVAVLVREKTSCKVAMVLGSQEPGGFSIKELPDGRSDTQLIEASGFTQWDWRVTPVKSGQLHLLLYVTPMLYIDTVGESIKRFKQPPRLITVNPDYWFEFSDVLKSHWGYVTTLVGLALASLLFYFRRQFTGWVEGSVRNTKAVYTSAAETKNGDAELEGAGAETLQPIAKRAVYLSYAWRSDSNEIANGLRTVVESEGFELFRDKDDMNPGDRISDFMKKIANADLIILVLSAKYLRSVYCMRELYGIYRHSDGEAGEFLKRIVPLTLGDAAYGTWEERLIHAQYWRSEYERMETSLSHLGGQDLLLYRSMKDWHNSVGDILAFVNDKLHPHSLEESLKGDYQAVRLMLRGKSERSFAAHA